MPADTQWLVFNREDGFHVVPGHRAECGDYYPGHRLADNCKCEPSIRTLPTAEGAPPRLIFVHHQPY